MTEDNAATASASEELSAYRLLLRLINAERQRLLAMDTIFLFANLVISIFFLQTLLAHPQQFDLVDLSRQSGILPVTMALLLLATGMALSAYWITNALRNQMKLKLRYFQARGLERRLEGHGFSFLRDEETFFGSHVLKGPQGELSYPGSIDGAMGRVKQRIWTWFLPMIFFVGDLYAFVYLIGRL